MTTQVPVIFIIFNRPDTTRQAFETIRAAKPTKLLVIADGPRPGKPDEADKCAATRAIIEEIDWECELHRNFSETNLGCRRRVASGITWAFGLVDKAIILEDDCLPSPSFFRYCAELLDRYEHDDRVMMVSGNNHLFGHADVSESYYFSRYPHCWGWATWRRAWTKYDLEMSHWPELRDRQLFDQYFRSKSEQYYWEAMFQLVYNGKVDTWDYQWFYTLWANSGVSVTPAQNLVQNIGFHAEATHTHTKWDKVYASLGADEIDFPLSHPTTVLTSSDKDRIEARLRVAYHSTGLLYVYNKFLALTVLIRRARKYAQRCTQTDRQRRLGASRRDHGLPSSRTSV